MPTGPRKYTCKTCSKAYVKAEHLIRHQRIHTGEKPFACAWCKHKFARQDSLARHQQRQHHNDVPLTVEPNDSIGDSLGAVVSDHTVSYSAGINSGDGIAPSLLQDAMAPTERLQSYDAMLPQCSTDDLFMRLTWPDSEDLLQSILTSNLGPWSDNIELLPSQYVLPDPVQTPGDSGSPWLSGQQTENSNNAIRKVSQIISDLSANVTLEAESAALSTVFLDGCLHMFFDQFVPQFMVCHRPTFVFRDWTHPLLLNAIALGSLFIGQEVNVAKGEVLWKLAHTAVATSWHSLILHLGPHDSCNGVQLILTALLGQTYAMLSGTARLRSTAQIFHSLGFYWARQCDMYKFKKRIKSGDVTNAETSEQKIGIWKRWAAEEVRLRALLGHYILDGQLSYFTGGPTCQRHASNSLPLPCSDALFSATTVEEWMMQLDREHQEPTTFRQLFVRLFANSGGLFQSEPPLSSLTMKVIIEGLESFVCESNSVEGTVVGSPSNKAIAETLKSIREYITSTNHYSAGEKIELLLRCHIVCIDAEANFNILCRNLCSQFAIDQTVFGNLKVDESLIDLKGWTDSARARIVLLHAVEVWKLLAEMPLGQGHAIHVPITIFVAATVFCAFILAGVTTISVPDPVDWTSLMSIDLEQDSPAELIGDSQLVRYLHKNLTMCSGSPKNLLYDCNVFLMRLRQLRRPWGICVSFESIVEQWLSKCGM